MLLLLRSSPDLTGSILAWDTGMGPVLLIVVMVAAGSIRVDMSRPRMNLHRGEHLATKLVLVANMDHLGTQLVMVTADGSIRVDMSRPRMNLHTRNTWLQNWSW
jgi:hypothetical protein